VPWRERLGQTFDLSLAPRKGELQGLQSMDQGLPVSIRPRGAGSPRYLV